MEQMSNPRFVLIFKVLLFIPSLHVVGIHQTTPAGLSVPYSAVHLQLPHAPLGNPQDSPTSFETQQNYRGIVTIHSTIKTH